MRGRLRRRFRGARPLARQSHERRSLKTATSTKTRRPQISPRRAASIRPTVSPATSTASTEHAPASALRTISPWSATCGTSSRSPIYSAASGAASFAAGDRAGFVDANANLHPDNMAVTCGHGELIDVRFCLTKDLKAFSTCPKVSGHTCQRSSVVVQPLR